MNRKFSYNVINKHVLSALVLGLWGLQGVCYGESGQGFKDRLTPVQISEEARAREVTCGASHTIIRQTDHSVGCLGLFDGQESPQLSHIGNIIQVASGKEHTLLLRSDRTVWAYGKGDKGQLGNGKNEASMTPVRVTGLAGITAIGAGGDSSLAICGEDKSIATWGSNEFGQLGDGTTENRSTPVKVLGLTEVADVAMGKDHAVICKNDGSVLIWGNNKDRQILAKDTPKITAPEKVSEIGGIKAVAAGDGFSLALSGSKTVAAWGINSVGQLGLGEKVSITAVPTTIPKLTNVEQITAGSSHVLARLGDGTLSAWGSNGHGQLGNGTRENQYSPVTVKRLSGVTDIAAGGRHSCAVRNDHTAWIWGDNRIPEHRHSADLKANAANSDSSANGDQKQPPLVTFIPPLSAVSLLEPAQGAVLFGQPNNPHRHHPGCIKIDIHLSSSDQ